MLKTLSHTQEPVSEDPVVRLLEPYAILPSQLPGRDNNRDDWRKRISYALLAGAVNVIFEALGEHVFFHGRHTCAIKSKRALQGRAKEAYAWVMGAPAPVSFDLVCGVLKIDEDYLRGKLNRHIHNVELQKALAREECDALSTEWYYISR